MAPFLRKWYFGRSSQRGNLSPIYPPKRSILGNQSRSLISVRVNGSIDPSTAGRCRYHSLWWWERGDYKIYVSTYDMQGQSHKGKLRSNKAVMSSSFYTEHMDSYYKTILTRTFLHIQYFLAQLIARKMSRSSHYIILIWGGGIDKAQGQIWLRSKFI